MTLDTPSLPFVHAWVRRRAALHPGRTALSGPAGAGVSYGELAYRAGRLAARLRALGVGPDAPVAVLADRSADFVVAMLGVLEAGGVVAPIDPAYPGRRVAELLARLSPAALVAAGEVPPELAPGVPVVRPDDGDRGEGAPAAPPLGPENLAYVLHTSGSTGVPKAVGMSHRGLSRLIAWQAHDGPPALATLHFANPTFDVVFQEVFATLCTGGTLVLVDGEARRDPERLLHALDTRGVERIFLPFAALGPLAKAGVRLGVAPRALSHVVTAGERLVVTEALRDFFRALPGCRLDNHYGPTEAHLVTRYTLVGVPAAWPDLPPIGDAVAGVEALVLDDALASVPPGTAGELYVAGEGLARGYLGAPAATAERFVPAPSGPAGARIYRTGDIARTGSGARLHFVGRADNQLKVRGYRVEPAEVELALAAHSGVREVAVGVRPLAEAAEGLVAYVVAQGAPPPATELARHAREVLPPFMVPALFIFLPSLPLTSSGKVDRRALAAIELPPRPAASASPGEPLAAIVRGIWERVLGHDEIGEDDDFFEVGGDSLLAAWVVTEIQLASGHDVELSLLLRNPTLALLTRALEAGEVRPRGTPSASEVVTLRPGPSGRPLFLVHPLGGELVAYRALALGIRSPLRLLGLRWRPADGGAPASLEEIAAAHRVQLRAVQPSGPYLLAGWSFGGVLAFELAQQLAALGERVDFLGLFDANPVRDPLTGLPIGASPHLGLLERALAEIDRGPGDGGPAPDVGSLFADPAWTGLLGDSIPAGLPVAHLRKNLRVARDSMDAAARYRPAPYAGAIDLFQAADTAAAVRESLAAELRGLARGALRIHSVPGDHTGILRPPLVEDTARAVDLTLDSL